MLVQFVGGYTMWMRAMLLTFSRYMPALSSGLKCGVGGSSGSIGTVDRESCAREELALLRAVKQSPSQVLSIA
jgi:hypothetical protein